MPEDTKPALPEPTEGGSYSRDPETGALTRISPKAEEPPARTWPPEGAVQAPAQPADEE